MSGRVLVVDDEENIRLVLRTLLKKNGYEVEVADSGEAALSSLDAFDPDVILTDVPMMLMAFIVLKSAFADVRAALKAAWSGALSSLPMSMASAMKANAAGMKAVRRLALLSIIRLSTP